MPYFLAVIILSNAKFTFIAGVSAADCETPTHDQGRWHWSAHPAFLTDGETLERDMTSAIALQGLPCGQVVAVKVNGENDYACVCKDGNRYRVYMNPAKRVVVEKQK